MGFSVIKISGSLSDDSEALLKLAQYIKQLQEQRISPVIVHGGGKQVNDLCRKLNIDVQQLAGRRITSEEVLDVVIYIIAGKLNKKIVSNLRLSGIDAVGLTGADGGITTARKRTPIAIDGSDVDFGLVGEILNVHPLLLERLCSSGFIPVIGCITWSEVEGLLNINGDTFAQSLASELQAEELIFLMEPHAVYDNFKQGLESITPALFHEGERDGWISSGMRPKLQNGFTALRNGCQSVRITNTHGLMSNTGTMLNIT